MTLDPVAFVSDALSAAGAWVDGGQALLPDALAARLGVTDVVELDACGFGSALLDGLVELERARVVRAGAASSLLPPRPAHARALAEAFPIRNGVSAVRDVTPGFATYAVLALAWSVESDERHEGVDVGTIALEDAALPTAPLHVDPDLAAQDADVDAPAGLTAALLRLAPTLVSADEPIGLVRRRHAREHGRISAYYADLVAEARRPSRRVDPAAIAAKVAHLLSERDARLADLGLRYAPRVSARVASVLLLSVPVVRVTVTARRRKGERALTLRLPAGSRALDRPACAGCGGWAHAGVALCDDQLHLLCERCVPEAVGRPACAACAGRR